MIQNSKILLVGGSGFLGNEIGISLCEAGFKVNILTRSPDKIGSLSYPATQFCWDSDGGIPEKSLAGVHAVVNLSGESISMGRWTVTKKRKIIDSRVDTTSKVVEAANRHHIPTLIQTSAIGYYGDTGDSRVDETSKMGQGFLAETAYQWEKPLDSLCDKTRKVTMRIGVVLGTTGGAFPEILNPYVAGVGATIGRGSHFISWIHIQDLCRFVVKAVENQNYNGIYNLTAPKPISYQSLHERLIARFGGFRFLKVPGLLLRLILGGKISAVTHEPTRSPKKIIGMRFYF